MYFRPVTYFCMEKIAQIIKHLPHEPGVYQYFNTQGEIIYVGKAIDLAKRVRQYFKRDDALGEKTAQLVSEIADIHIIPTTSEFDALLLEAKLIHTLLPKYNAALRDDKSPLYVGFTMADQLPRVLWLRKPELSQITKNMKNKVFGPFQSPLALRTLLRFLRAAVPYCIQKQRTGRPCFYTHIGLCNPCPSEIVRMQGDQKILMSRMYRTNIHKLISIFEGHASAVIRAYEKEMKQYACNQQFEQAQQVKHRIETMYQISQKRYDPAIFLDRGATDVYKDELNELHSALQVYYPKLSSLSRIECYDISQLSGSAAVGSMVVLTNGRSDTSEYRRFRIKTVKGISDTDMMKEIIQRRIAHTEWKWPDFILVDGGKGQVRAAGSVFYSAGIDIPYAGLAKRNEEIIFYKNSAFVTLRLPLSGKAIKVAQRIRDEAHRFAITYNRLLRSKQLLVV